MLTQPLFLYAKPKLLHLTQFGPKPLVFLGIKGVVSLKNGHFLPLFCP